jgi:hypothetical protein
MPTVDELITDIGKGGLKLPEFQRGYVWTRDQVRTFVQSLYRGHPTGQLLLWHAYTPVPTRGGTGGESSKTLLLLDGQQRLTTLYALIKGSPPPFYEGEDLFFDLWFNVADEEFSYFNKTLMEGNPVWFSVHEFLNQGMNSFLDQVPTLDETRRGIAEKSLSKFNALDRLHSYHYHTDDLKDEKLELEEVVEIFNRVNSKGTPLSRADLAMAHICIFWPEARSEMRGFMAEMKAHGFDLELALLVRATSAVAGGSVNFDASFYQVSADALKEAWPKVRSAFEYLVNVLKHDAYIDSKSDLASPIVLVPMVVFLANNGSTFSSAAQQNSFLRWMYLANVWGRYTGQTDTKLRRDILSLSEPEPTTRLVQAILEDRGRIEVMPSDLEGKGTSSASALYKFSYVLARSRGSKDWFTGQTLYQKAIGKSNGLQSHHIFPRAVLKKMGITERAVVNQIANRAFLTQKANLKIAAREPSKYLPDVEEDFPGALRQQFVPMNSELWFKNEYLAFFEQRRRLLARAMNSFIAKLAPGEGEAQGVVGIDALLQEDESQVLEFKSTLRWDLDKGYTNKDLEAVVVKTVAGFLNSDGGHLLIGVEDDKSVVGLHYDYESSQSIGGRDGFERHLNAILRKAVGDATMTFLTTTFHSVEKLDTCQVSIEPSDHPVYVLSGESQSFYVRQGNATRSLDPKETFNYVQTHWKVI